MKCWVFGSTDLILSHDHVGVQGQPLTGTLLDRKEGTAVTDVTCPDLRCPVSSAEFIRHS